MRVTKVTPGNLVEMYEVDLPVTSTDDEVLEATIALAPVTAVRESGAPHISWRELTTLDDVAAQLAATRAAYEQATEQAKGILEEAAAAGVSERELSRKLGVDRLTIRRWRNK